MVTLLSRYVNNLRKDRRAERSATRQTLRPPQRALAGIPKRSPVICTPPEARGSILRDCNHLWKVRPPHRDTGANKGSICRYDMLDPFLKPLLFEHGRETLNRVRGRCSLRTSPVRSSKKFAPTKLTPTRPQAPRRRSTRSVRSGG